MSKFWSSLAKQVDPYIPGEQLNDDTIIKLNTNENPYPPSNQVIQAIDEASKNLRLYPSPTVDELRSEIGEMYGLSQDHIFIGNGSDEVLAFSFMSFFEPGNRIKYPEITYSFYPVYAKLFNISTDVIPLNDDYTIPVEHFYNSEGGVIFPNPNAPTGIFLEIDQIKRILENNPNQVVIIDEAYIDFALESAVTLVEAFPNLLVIQTMSKSRSLAGLRIGFAIGNPELIIGLERIKNSFNSYTVDRLAIAGAIEAIRDKDYFLQTTTKIIESRSYLKEQLETRHFDILPSQANFLLVSHKEVNAEVLYQELKKQGILVRYFQKPGLENFLRISIGTPAQIEKLLKKIDHIIKPSP
ncbi:histidinol-phosphate transaminase [Oceanobacillus iheyensis]|uniref:Histidinol-phosphate aminotransferase 1 n=1 Tax=Oceanobacillus iheyensis (strain DSM 14371 / CIP 107618 / JCM 11309 / KCTC 3954 / HTE831) TaxID=221109 RepID=HIS81_OCEIH|nr:histidinol-phosphate transaminase [Oceanobacillus iheyensis]Q8ESS3.1 RecName: Full=Histidinol-phosphate aminotransferase 1; AltName: Full=Imidazole acetol-phosphate transaminase 1 [Oceanobacillus iheyensis HTE831]BAC12501.1 histidinol-phosphate aminotransferase [Oceanobacillus iheyensis HTE831]